MCVPGCLEHVHERVANRRGILRGAAAMAAVATVGTGAAPAMAQPRSFSRAVDLTHTLTVDFPNFFNKPQVEVEVMATWDQQKFNMKRWSIVEHTGTHLDAPFHFSSDGASVDQIPAEKLVVPLVVIDIAGRAATDADAQLTPDDVAAFEQRHGTIAPGTCVAMHSGWASRVKEPGFRNAGDDNVMHFPGFHVETARLLIERDAVGIASDTLSLDFGRSPDFAVHYAWLPSGRWGIECIAGLDQLPATGATIVVGAPTFQGGTGGPSRIIALL